MVLTQNSLHIRNVSKPIQFCRSSISFTHSSFGQFRSAAIQLRPKPNVKWGVGTETEPKLHFRSVSVPKPKPNFGRSLSEVRIFELRFNYSYSNSNAGNLIFVCKGAKGFNSRWRIVYGDGEPPTMCHCTHWAGEEWEVRQRSFSDRTDIKWPHPRDVIDGLITACTTGQAARRDVWWTCLQRRDAGRRRPIAAIASEVVV